MWHYPLLRSRAASAGHQAWIWRYRNCRTQWMQLSGLNGFLAITSQPLPLGPEVIYNHLHNNGLTLIKLVNSPEHWLKKWEMESVDHNILWRNGVSCNEWNWCNNEANKCHRLNVDLHKDDVGVWFEWQWWGAGSFHTDHTARPGAGLGEVNDKIIVYCCSTTITVLMQDCGLRH